MFGLNLYRALLIENGSTKEEWQKGHSLLIGI